MVLKYDMDISNEAINKNLTRLTNQIYKLLPMREEGNDWKTPLITIIEEFAGMSSILKENETQLFSLLCKLEGLMIFENDFFLYRRTIFECLNMVGGLKKDVGI